MFYREIETRTNKKMLRARFVKDFLRFAINVTRVRNWYAGIYLYVFDWSRRFRASVLETSETRRVLFEEKKPISSYLIGKIIRAVTFAEKAA